MSFLNPVLLLALPAITLPLIIHLINRRRFRRKAWGPIMFLREAMREKRGHHRLREWLVLACRMLALAALVFAVSRPLIGGWLAGWIGAGDQAVMIVLDRSASMGMRPPNQTQTKQKLAITALMKEVERVSPSAMAVFDGLQVREIKNISALAELPDTDTQTDWPSALLAALRGWRDTPYARGELWLASDLQTTDWQPDHSAWPEIRKLYDQQPNPPKLRLLTLRGQQPNLTLTCKPGDSRQELLITIAKQGMSQTNKVTLTWQVDGNQHLQSVSLTDTVTTVSLPIPGNSTTTLRQGSLTLPDDNNLRDNQAYFAIDQASDLFNIVVSENPAIARLLQLACSPWHTDEDSIQTLWRRPTDLQDIDWAKVPLVIWQSGDSSSHLEPLINRGGQLLLFPGGNFDTLRFGNTQEPPGDEPLQVTTWERNRGPLADTASGKALPLEQLQVYRWAPFEPDGTTLAFLGGQQALFHAIPVGNSHVHACTTLPTPTWSNLGEGLILLPMVQRLIHQGVQALASVDWRDCDASSPIAGLTTGAVKTVVNVRPLAEDVPTALSEDEVMALFAGMDLTTFDLSSSDSETASEGLASEWSRPLLIIMLLLLVAESLLTLPANSQRSSISSALS